MGEKEAKSSRCCLVGLCKYFLFCYPLGNDSSNLGEQRRAQKHPPSARLVLVVEDCAVCQGCRACKLPPPVPSRSIACVILAGCQGRVEGGTRAPRWYARDDTMPARARRAASATRRAPVITRL